MTRCEPSGPRSSCATRLSHSSAIEDSQLGVKLGVESGEVFIGAGARRSRFAAGGAFNVAARLQETAPEGEILLGENVHRLVHGAVRAQRLQQTHAWRLLELESEGSAIARSPASPFVGRQRELDALRGAFGFALTSRTAVR